MKEQKKLSALAASVLAIGLLLGASAASAQTVIFGDSSNPAKATAIQDLNVGGMRYNVEFLYARDAQDVYGPLPGDYDFNTDSSARAAVEAVNDALNAEDALFVGSEDSPVNIEPLSEIYFVGFERGIDIPGIGPLPPVPTVNAWAGSIPDLTWIESFDGVVYADARTWAKFTAADGGGNGSVDLTGTVENADGTGLCALVLASGDFMFSCNPNGPYSLTDLPREGDGTVKRQVYVDGFFPEVDVLQGSVDETVVMTRAGDCPDYNSFTDPSENPGSAGKRIDISGTVLLQNSQTPVCAIVLANGQFEFTCDGTGSYSGNIPLDNNGQFKLQVYADGFAPMVQKFDESSPNNNVRMARAAECQ